MARTIDRRRCVELIQEWFAGKEAPVIAFPDKNNYPNIVYLYHEDAKNMSEEASRLMEHLSYKLKSPVVTFIDPIYKIKPEQVVQTCEQWLNCLE